MNRKLALSSLVEPTEKHANIEARMLVRDLISALARARPSERPVRVAPVPSLVSAAKRDFCQRDQVPTRESRCCMGYRQECSAESCSWVSPTAAGFAWGNYQEGHVRLGGV